MWGPPRLNFRPSAICIFINDLPISLNDTKVSCDMFADDNTLHTSDKTIGTVKKILQQGLDIVQDWCQKNKMVLNPEKNKWWQQDKNTKGKNLY